MPFESRSRRDWPGNRDSAPQHAAVWVAESEPAEPMFTAGRIGAERLSTSRPPDQRRDGP